MMYHKKNRPPLKISDPAGFTLIELLLAIMISTMIMGASFSAYLAANQSWDKGRAVSNQYQVGRVALSKMEQYLRSVIEPNEGGTIIFDGDYEYSTGKESNRLQYLQFSSCGEYIRPEKELRSDLCELKFFLKEHEEDNLYSLIMRKRLLPSGYYEDEQGDVTIELADRVIGLEFTYLKGSERLKEWVGESGLPRSVEIKLILAGVEKISNDVQFTKMILLNTTRTSMEDVGDESEVGTEEETGEETQDEAPEETT